MLSILIIEKFNLKDRVWGYLCPVGVYFKVVISG